MNFYQLLNMNEGGLKRKIKESESAKDKCFYFFVLAFRAFLIVCFAVLVISVGSAFFGADNSALAVVLLVTIMTIRFVHFSYRIEDTVVTLAVVMAIYTFAPAISFAVPAPLVFVVHFIALFLLICITCQKPQMGLGGLIGFSYCYLVGNSVSGEALMRRAGLAVAGFIICAAIMIHQHRHKDREVRFHHFFKNYKVSSTVNLWQLRLALGIAIILSVGQIFEVPRFMWLGFACSTLLARFPYSGNLSERFLERVEGVVIGSLGFIVLCHLIPESTWSLIGLVAGFFLAFCATYRWKTIIICFSALSMAIGLYGVEGAAIMRIVNHTLGASFAMIFADGYDKLFARKVSPIFKEMEEKEKEKEKEKEGQHKAS